MNMPDRVGRVGPPQQPDARRLSVVSDTLTTGGKPLSANETLVREAIDAGAKNWTEVADYVQPRCASKSFSRQAARQTAVRRGWALKAKKTPREVVVSFRTRAASVDALDELVTAYAGVDGEGMWDVDRSDLIRLFIERGYQDVVSGKRTLPSKYLRKKP